jgi:hypothetical protein
MRFYGKKILRTSIGQAVEFHVESRDAVCYDVLPAQRVARVKIQGSSTLIIANYPQSWVETPDWLKSGNAVRITHTGGLRGRVELSGSGTFIPTPVEDDPGPGTVTPGDAVVSGLQIQAAATPSLTMTITAGTYRIGGIIYSYAGGTQAISAGSGTPGYFRIDIIAIDAAGALHYIPGTAGTNPGAPTVPAGQVELGRILVAPGSTAITQGFINRAWMTRTATSFTLTPAAASLTWGTTTDVVTFSVTDQYGIALSGTWNFTAQIVTGNGDIGGTAAPGVYSGSFSGSSTTLTYTRTGLSTEQSPVIKAVLTLSSGQTIDGATFITLLNSSGDPEIGGGGGSGSGGSVDSSAIYNLDGGRLSRHAHESQYDHSKIGSGGGGLTGPGAGVDSSGIIFNADGGRLAQFNHEARFDHSSLSALQNEVALLLSQLESARRFIHEHESVFNHRLLVTPPGPSGLTYWDDLGGWTTPAGLSPEGGVDILAVEVFM